MRVQLSPSIDFNQMLVFSVFGHLLLLTAVLFLPKPSRLDKVVVPAFMVNLVSEPMGSRSKEAAPKRSKPSVKVEKPKVKKLSQKVPALKKAKVSKPPVVEELDQLARLEKPKQKPLASKPIKKKTATEETFREKEVKAVVPVPLMEESLLETRQKEVSVEKQQKQEPEKTVTEKPQAPKVDLLKKLQQLANKSDDATPVPEVEAVKPQKSTQKSSESYDSIIEKLSLLSVSESVKQMKVELPSDKLDSTVFRSHLRTVKIIHTSTDSGAGDSDVFAKKKGVPGADMQSLYVRKVREIIYNNWEVPLAEEYKQETVVSFSIFPDGKVDELSVKKSSGVEALDKKAVKAVLAKPFPKFPPELKMLNLHISIYFKYVSNDK